VVWGQVLVGAWLFLLFLVVMRVPVDLYQVQIRFSVPGTKGDRCTRYKSGSVYQVQKGVDVPGTNQVQCTRYKRGLMYQVQIRFSVPGTKGDRCTRNKLASMSLVHQSTESVAPI
jgi:hypothetical protein